MTPSESSIGRTLASSIGIQVCINGCLAGVRMASPLLALRAGYSPAAVGVLLALYAFVQLFLAIPAGRYADRHPMRRPVLLCTGIAVLGACVAALWPVFPVLCLVATMTGGATGVTVIFLQRHAGRIARTPTELKQVFSWLAIAPSVANFLGPALAGVIIDLAGFRACFVAMGGLALTAGLLVRHVPEPSIESTGETRLQRSIWALLRDRKMRTLLFISWILTCCWDVHTFMVPILGHERGFSASIIGLILGAFAVAATAVRLVIPVIAARLREWAVITLAMGVTALLYAIYPLLLSPLAMGTCSVLLGLWLGSVQPMVMSTLHQITPPDRQGEALGLRLMSINVSSILMPLVFGSLGTAIGVGSVFWIVAAGVGCGAPAGWRLKSWKNADRH